MALTPAERQAAYRARRNEGDGDRRLNTWVSTGTALALARLANRYAVTQREMLERLIAAADAQVLQGLELDTPEWNAYLAVNGKDKHGDIQP